MSRSMWPYHPDLLERAVPRYTSYPTAAEFSDAVGGVEQAAASTRVSRPVSLYVHIPFCERICWYCGCNTGASNRSQRLHAYLDALEAETDLAASLMPVLAAIERIAFGGGSPNAISPLAFVRLLDRILTAFGIGQPDLSIELDPRSLTRQWIGIIGAVGVGSVSLGVQTFAPHVQAAIGRIQPREQIEDSVAGLRSAGVASLNFDLMYGLPGQKPGDLAETLDIAIGMRPDRIALFGYAHVPEILPRQRRIDGTRLPDQANRFAMASEGHDRLVAAGYRAIGFDHFALPHDPLARADAAGTLRRNFQGFTDDDASSLIGLGASAISLFGDIIVQNDKNSGSWRQRVAAGSCTGVRGIHRSPKDRAIGAVIEDILCLRPADMALVGCDAQIHALDRQLAPFIERDVIERSELLLLPTAATRPYARSIAALFDPYRASAMRQFSTAV